ncbi:MAG: hypothetical protein IPQ27_02450 [Chitinophagaceae bacterium]|nr:hypothetical protein [Chitinophagaceae bacterium]
MNKYATLYIVLLFAFCCPVQSQEIIDKKTVIHFVPIANGKPVQPDSIYQNAFGETYSVSKLKYYLSNFSIGSKVDAGIYLIDAFAADSVILQLPLNAKGILHFQLGVDSMYNCSGAQSGALDPLNGMFWTWNTGYINFKLEGYSAFSSTNIKNIEYHIGGYAGENKTMRKIQLPYSLPKKTQDIYIQFNLDNFWKSSSAFKIAELPVITSPGKNAKTVADNFSALFSILPQ